MEDQNKFNEMVKALEDEDFTKLTAAIEQRKKERERLPFLTPRNNFPMREPSPKLDGVLDEAMRRMDEDTPDPELTQEHKPRGYKLGDIPEDISFGDEVVDPREMDAQKGVLKDLMKMLRGMDSEAMDKVVSSEDEIPADEKALEIQTVKVEPLPMEPFTPKNKKSLRQISE